MTRKTAVYALLGALICLSSTNILAACFPCPTNAIGWWSAEGNAYDIINVREAVLQNGAGYAPGKVCQAFSFDGPTEKVRIAESTRTDISRTNRWTIEAWIKPASFNNSSFPTIYSEGNKVASLGINNGTGKLESWINNNSATRFVSTTTLMLNGWNHVALVRDGAIRTFYINGTAAGGTNSTPVTTPDSTGAAIGHATQDDPATAFQGEIDELSLYNRALTASEIAGIYAAGDAGKCYTNSQAPYFVLQPVSQTGYLGGQSEFRALAAGSPCTSYQWLFNGANKAGATNFVLALSNLTFAHAGDYTLVASSSSGVTTSATAHLTVPFCVDTTNLVSWWPADGSGLEVSGQHHAAVWGGVAYGNGIAGGAFDFNGSDAYLAIPHAPALSPQADAAGEITVEAWVNLATLPQTDPYSGQPRRTVLSKGDYGRWEYGLSISNSGVPEFFVWTPSGSVYASAIGGQITTSNWHHLVGVLKRGQSIAIYQNGALMNENTNLAGTITNTDSPLYIGRRGDGQFLNGLVDEAAIYKSALTSNDIAVLYAGGSFGKCAGGSTPIPFFAVQPTGQAGDLFRNAGLAALAIGTPRPAYQWLQGDLAVSGMANATLVWSNNSGTYSVAATSPAGSANSNPGELEMPCHQMLCGGESFELGWNGWSANNSIWQIGVPTSGPGAAHHGRSVAGTVLSGSYPQYTASRLISPVIILPVVTGNEEVQLRFWHWFNYANGEGKVQLSVSSNGVWSPWLPLATPAPSGRYSGPWSPAQLDLTRYAGQEVRLSFLHTSDYYVSSGWYVDEVQIWKGIPTFNNPEKFENGWGDWHAEYGVWEIGSEGAATVLSGNYPQYTASRLISPRFDLPDASGNERLQLRIWHAYSYANGAGYAQLSVWTNGGWGGWETLGTPATSGVSGGVWSQACFDLTRYAGQRVRLAFYHTSDYYVANGWNIDQVEIWKGVPIFNNPEEFNNGWGDWSAEHGVWEIGSGRAATVLSGSYPQYTDSRLVSPEFVLPDAVANERLQVRIWHAYSYANGAGYVQLSVWTNGQWSAWETLGTPATSGVGGGVWSWACFDLTRYAAQRVRLGFYHTSDYYVGDGWSIDQVQIWKGVPKLNNPENFNEWGDWCAEHGVWEITSGRAVTVGSGNYPQYTASRLVSPEFVLPDAIANERVELRIWHAYSYANGAGYVQLSVWTNEAWAPWITLGTPASSGVSGAVWSWTCFDLTQYAGQTIRVGFYHTSDYYVANGWNIEQMKIWKGVPAFNNPETFEYGWGDWCADHGVWEIGTPASGPSGAHSGTNVLATVLSGNYPQYTASRFISPEFVLPSVATGEPLELRFWHSFNYANGRGDLQLAVYSNDVWSSWLPLTNAAHSGASSGGWQLARVPVAAYAGQRIKLAFSHTSDYYVSSGWSIDDLFIKRGNIAIAAIQAQTVAETNCISFRPSVIGADRDSLLSFSLPWAPAGAMIDPETGVFSWCPSECQGPGVYTIPIYVVDFGNNEANDLGFVTITVTEVNERPWLLPTTGTAYVGRTNEIRLCSGDPDCPRNPLTYSLVSSGWSGGTIDTNGVLKWVPTQPGTYTNLVRLCDGGSPNYCVTNTIVVTVTDHEPFKLQVGRVSQDVYEITIINGRTDVDYVVEQTSALCGCPCKPVWEPIGRISPTTVPFSVRVQSPEPMMFYRAFEVPR